MENFTHLDADESIFFLRQLEYLKSQSYDIKYATLKIRDVVPLSFEAGPGAESITYEQFENVGIAKIVANYATDFPRADVKGKEFTSIVKSIGSSYGYNVQEVRAANLAGKPLVQRKSDSSRRAVAQKENDIGFFGDAGANIQGWLTNPNIPDVTLATGDWLGAATPDQIIADLNNLAHTVVDQSLGVEAAQTMLMPIKYLTYLSATPRSSTSDTTILSFFMGNNGFISDVDWLNELDATRSKGNLAADTCIVYDRNPTAFTYEIPQEFETFPPQEQGMEFVIHTHERVGGVIIYYPLSQAKTDDIGA